MQILLMSIAALGLLGAALYAHQRIAFFTRGTARVTITRALLVLVGIGFGWLSAAQYEKGWPQWLASLIGFGLVHVPAAVILFIKGKRGADRS